MQLKLSWFDWYVLFLFSIYGTELLESPLTSLGYVGKLVSSALFSLPVLEGGKDTEKHIEAYFKTTPAGRFCIQWSDPDNVQQIPFMVFYQLDGV